MTILRSAPPSPFGRKVRIALLHLGLADRVDIVAADTASETDTIRRQNPLGKIPTLITENGKALYDSPVILEYLDHLAGGNKIIPVDPDSRFAALTLQALADGILDASILRVMSGATAPKTKWSKPGLLIKPARSSARSLRSKPRRRAHTSMSARLRLPARSAIRTCVLPGRGAASIRASSAGSMHSRRLCRRSKRRGSSRE